SAPNRCSVEQELEAHYGYMAKIQEQSESVSNTCLVKTDDSNVIPDSPDVCEDDIQNEQNDVESDDEHNFGMILGQPVHTNDDVKTIEFNRHEFNFKSLNLESAALSNSFNLYQHQGCIQTGGKIVKLDIDEDVTLEEVAAKVAKKDVDAHGRQEESQAQVYHIDLEHTGKVLSMQDDELEPAELKEVIKVVTTAKLMTKVVTAAATTITVALNDVRKRKGVVIRDPEETATPSTIVNSEPKSKDKGKGILVEEPKPLKK
nr:hypothetical protein [Tanacetum cinerariifolium]